MRALLCRQWGGPEALELADLPVPEPGPDQVLIEVAASAANYADLIMIKGHYQTRPAFPFAPGLEAAGTVVRCGTGVDGGPAPGTRVMALLDHSGFAEFAVADAAVCFPVPAEMDEAAAAAFLIAYASSHVALRWQARLARVETLLVLGAAGGVGLTAVEIGKAMGARVVAAASSAEKLKMAERHGADALVNYTDVALKEAVLELTDGAGADVCFDPVGGDLFDGALSALGWGGRYLHIGFVGGVPQVPSNRLLVKHRSAMGSSLRYFRQRRPDPLRASVDELLNWWREGRLSLEVSARFDLAQGAAALEALAARRVLGKVVVFPGSGTGV